MSNYGAAAMEAAYQKIKAERAPHWRVSEHAAFEQGWKACQAHAEALYAAEGQETPTDEPIAKRLTHTYMGDCPDEVNGWESRDPECPACRALVEVVPDDRA